MFKKLICLIFILVQTNVNADDPFYAQRGHVLAQDSWVFSPGKAKETRDKLIDLDTYTKLNTSLEKSLDLYKSNETIQQNKINLLLEQNDKLAKSLYDERTVTGWERFGYFALGIAATVFAGWAIGQARK